MSKCDCCAKGLTKRLPGLECNNCGKVVHASPSCSGLTAKQLSALRNADTIAWSCEECHHNSPKRKFSFIIPEDDNEDDDLENPKSNMNHLDYDKFLKEMVIEMKKVLKTELHPLEVQMGFCCQKVDELTNSLELQNKRLTELEKKYTNLKNENIRSKIELSVVKQYVSNLEQQRLENVVEITGIPKVPGENLSALCQKLSQLLKTDEKHVTCIKRMGGRNGQDGHIQVELKLVEYADMWVRASREQTVLMNQIIQDRAESSANDKVIVRRALTKVNKALLWQAQQKLRPSFKYVWFQGGKVLLRKEEKDKPVVVRCEDDIEKLSTSAGTPNVGR